MVTESEKVAQIDWLKKQFDVLAAERRAFDRYMWQLPFASLGVVALIVGSSIALHDDIPESRALLCIGFTFSAIVCLYAAVSLCRFKARRSLREERMKKIEERVAVICSFATDSISVVTTGKEVTSLAEKSKRWEVRHLGKQPTTRLGTLFLCIIAAIFFTWALLVWFI